MFGYVIHIIAYILTLCYTYIMYTYIYHIIQVRYVVIQFAKYDNMFYVRSHLVYGSEQKTITWNKTS